jgi:hypothetical protein
MDVDKNREKDTTVRDSDRDTSRQETQVNRDTDGQGLGHRRTGTVTQMGRQRGRDPNGQEE